jgi:hypothetical protein
VAWHTLARYGVVCRGPAEADLKVWTDPDRLLAWTDDNLDRHWRRLLDRCSHPLGLAGMLATSRNATVWIVTGATRLHYTLATGNVISKIGAARDALDTFPSRWHRVIEEAIRLRTGEGIPRYRSPFARRRDVLAYGHMVIDDAHRLHATHP